MKLQKDSSLSIYCQIGKQIKQKILRGGFPEGKLPLARDLAKKYGVSLLTIHRAISLLLEDGTCLSKPRVGIYINPMVFSGGKRRIVYVGSAFYHGADMEYGSRLLGLKNPDLYPGCQIDATYLNFVSGDSHQLEYELRGICAKHLDCLILDIDRKMSRPFISELLNLSVPIFVIGDFPGGEVKEPLLNQIREDTGERGAAMVDIALEAGKTDVVIVTHDEKSNYYVRLLREGAEQAAAAKGVRVRFLSHDEDMTGRDAEWKSWKVLAEEGLPEAVILDGYYGDAEAYLGSLRQAWQVGEESILFMSTGNYLEKGLFVHWDYSAFARKASSLILSSMVEKSRFVGQHTLSGLIAHQIYKPFG